MMISVRTRLGASCRKESERLERIDRRLIIAGDRSLDGLRNFIDNDAALNGLIQECRDLKKRLGIRNEEITREPSIAELIWRERDG